MKRRVFLQCGLAAGIVTPLWAALKQERINDAIDVLNNACAAGQVASAVLHISQRNSQVTRHFGGATTNDAMFLLGSISKPICVAALMTLYDKNRFRLDDRLQKFLPQFKGDGRDDVTIKHLLTHVSGLPDQLPENNQLRKSHAGLQEFVDHVIRTPLLFAPGSRYQYSSMAILLALEVARVITGEGILSFVDRTVFQPLGMKHSAIGLGRYKLEDMIPCQTEHAAPEAGGGDPTAKDWGWNSPYWRKLGAPWGGVHASALDIAKFLSEFLHAQGNLVTPQTTELMISNQNGPGLPPRGLGFDLRMSSGPEGSEKTFGHTGSTGTICWADPTSDTICVVLTSLPGRAANPHPTTLASKHIAAGTM